MDCTNSKNYKTKDSHLKTLLTHLKNRAKLKNLEFDLDFEYLKPLAVDFCPVFNIELFWADKRQKNCGNSPSVDRIDSTKGYLKGNVQIISNRANIIKNNATTAEIKLLLSHMEKTSG